MPERCRPRDPEQLDGLGRGYPSGPTEVLNESLGAGGQMIEDAPRECVGKEDDADGCRSLRLARIGPPDPSHLLEHPVHALAGLPRIAEVAERPGEPRIARE